jgi:ABC-type multidrug transport system fused ATPase/permease subunit
MYERASSLPTWAMEAAPAVVGELARRAGLAGGSPGSAGSHPVVARGIGRLAVEEALTAEAARLGLELEQVSVSRVEGERLVRSCGPALLAVASPAGTAVRLLAVVRSRGRRALVLTPDLQLRTIRSSEIAAVLGAPDDAGALSAIESHLDRIDLQPSERDRVRRALVADRLRSHRFDAGWLVRTAAAGGLRAQLREERLFGQLARFVAFYVVSYGLLLASWAVLGAAALHGRLRSPWLLAWPLLLLTLVVFRAGSVWTQARLTVAFGALLKRRLLQGALQLAPEELRSQGASHFVGRVIESQAVETQILGGGFLAVVGSIEAVLGGGVVFLGAAGLLHGSVLVGWILLTGTVGWRFLVARRRWSDCRMELTHELVDRLVGYRTRLAQEDRTTWHDAEDVRLHAYLHASQRFDRIKTALLAWMPRGWLLLSVVALAPAFVNGLSDPVPLAIGVGGTLAAWRGFAKLSEGFEHLSIAMVSWQYVADLSAAASRRREKDASLEPMPPSSGSGRRPVLEALDLSYRYPGRERWALDRCSLRVPRGGRVLLEGRSGGGKSTLASLLVGLREPTSGLVLLKGLDRTAIGEQRWRRHVALAPQFHENHVFAATLGFNLLMGRNWPAERGDLADAEVICRELGLGSLLDRMPSGMQQIVGETGWQLSHGERSRLFMARALLQRSDVLILDESLAALDPENLDEALSCVLRRAPTLIVVAHP